MCFFNTGILSFVEDTNMLFPCAMPLHFGRHTSLTRFVDSAGSAHYGKIAGYPMLSLLLIPVTPRGVLMFVGNSIHGNWNSGFCN